MKKPSRRELATAQRRGSTGGSTGMRRCDPATKKQEPAAAQGGRREDGKRGKVIRVSPWVPFYKESVGRGFTAPVFLWPTISGEELVASVSVNGQVVGQ